MNQRKNPVKRAFSGLVGLPPEPEAAFTPIPEPVPISKTEFVDRALVCNDCYQEFLFSAEDQELFAEHQSSPPRRCKSCEAEAIQQVEYPADTVVPPIVPSVPELLEQVEDTKAEKEAARSRANRKRRAEQKAAIKKAVRTPIAEIKAAAEARAKAIARPGSMNQGRYMRDAPTGKGELETGGYGPKKLEDVGAARGRSVGLGSHTIDPETGEAVWSDNDRKRAQAPGLGAPSDDNHETTGGAHLDESQMPRKFVVKLKDVDMEGAIRELAYEYVKEDESGRLCRLCESFVVESAADHIEAVHGDEREPSHDARFGNVINAYIEREERKEAKLRKAGRDKAREVIADAKARAEADATRAGYTKLNGKWIPKPRTA
jgi:hypothetical protein